MVETVYDGSDDNIQLVSTLTSVVHKLNVARLHVLQYQAQRDFFNHIISIEKNEVKNNLPVQFCKVIKIYMGPNLELSNFEGISIEIHTTFLR